MSVISFAAGPVEGCLCASAGSGNWREVSIMSITSFASGPKVLVSVFFSAHAPSRNWREASVMSIISSAAGACPGASVPLFSRPVPAAGGEHHEHH